MLGEFATPQRIARLTPLDDVLARIDALVKPVAARATAVLTDAVGRTLAEDIVIEAPIPHAALALRDGWAVQSELTTDAGPYAPAPLPAAVRIDMGKPIPSDADAVATLDAVAMRDGKAQALSPVAPGEGVLPAGADVARGATLIRAGRRLSRLELALLAALGIRSARIREPRLALARARSRGDRMIDAAVECIAHAIRCEGGLAVVREQNEALEDALRAADADAVVVVGGTGCGQDDRAVATLAWVGAVEVHGIGLIPGETSALGSLGARPALLLPGRLDAALAAWHVLGRAMLARLAATSEPLCIRRAELTRKVSSHAGLAELVPVACKDGFATPIASGYLSISTLAQANGWLLIAPESEGFQTGSEVMIRPWP
jgi:molybdopterin molybdotransferase